MLKTRLMTAAAAVALFAAPAAFAQEVPTTASTTAPPAQTAPAAPAATPAPAEAATTAPVAVQENNVVAVLRADGRFGTLISALEASGLSTVLESQPAVSIFAPTDEAFAALPEADRTRLMDPANVEELRALLLYHVIAADVKSSQITGARGGVPTAGGAQVQLDGTGDAIKIDDATVVTADIDAANGAVFAIDKVLTPSASQAAMGDEQPAAPAETEEPVAEPAAVATPATPAAPAQPAAERPVGVTQAQPPADEAVTADDDQEPADATPVPGEGEEEGQEEDPQA